MDVPEDKTLLLFDGYCRLCSRTVSFLLKFDKKKKFVFASLQNDVGNDYRTKYNIPEEMDSVIVIDGGNAFFYADAFFIIVKRLGGCWNLFLFFRIIPRRWVNAMYRWVARNRFRWFGRRESCFLPSEETNSRFL